MTDCLRSFGFVALWLVATLPAQAENLPQNPGLSVSSAATREKLESIAQRQRLAIVAEDWKLAYEFAASGIQQKFDLVAFATMVRGSYPALLLARTTTTLHAADNGTEATLDLRLIGQDNSLAYFRYYFAREGENWKIVGVVPADPPTVSA